MEERFETFTVLIAKISRSIKKIKNIEMADMGLKSIHVSCIYYLYLSDGLTAARLCDRCDEDKASISRSLLYLEENGYIRIGNEGSKKYNAPLLLTEKGKAVGKIIADKIDTILDEVSAGLSEDERIIMYRGLSLICHNLSERISETQEKGCRKRNNNSEQS